jgi:hypothetical protein
MKLTLQKSSWLHKELQNNSGLRQIITDVVEMQSGKSRRTSWRQPKSSTTTTTKIHHHHHHAPPPQQQQRGISATPSSAIGRNSSSSSNPVHDYDALLEKRQNHPTFDEFCDKLLVLAGVLELRPQQHSDNNFDRSRGVFPAGCGISTNDTSSSSSSTFLEGWLQQKWSQYHHHHHSPNGVFEFSTPVLVMKPVNKQQGKITMPKFQPAVASSSSSSSSEEEEEEEEEEKEEDKEEDGCSESESSTVRSDNR